MAGDVITRVLNESNIRRLLADSYPTLKALEDSFDGMLLVGFSGGFAEYKVLGTIASVAYSARASQKWWPNARDRLEAAEVIQRDDSVCYPHFETDKDAAGVARKFEEIRLMLSKARDARNPETGLSVYLRVYAPETKDISPVE